MGSFWGYFLDFFGLARFSGRPEATFVPVIHEPEYALHCASTTRPVRVTPR